MAPIEEYFRSLVRRAEGGTFSLSEIVRRLNSYGVIRLLLSFLCLFSSHEQEKETKDSTNIDVEFSSRRSFLHGISLFFSDLRTFVSLKFTRKQFISTSSSKAEKRNKSELSLAEFRFSRQRRIISSALITIGLIFSFKNKSVKTKKN